MDYLINDQCLLHIEASQSILHYSAAPILQSFTVNETCNLKATSLPFFPKPFLLV